MGIENFVIFRSVDSLCILRWIIYICRKLSGVTNEVRKAVEKDLGTLERIFDKARLFMKESGNPAQWIDGYPAPDRIMADIRNGDCYCVVDDAGHVVGTFAFIVGEDPNYKEIVTVVGSTIILMRRYTGWLPTVLVGVLPIPVSVGVLPGRIISESTHMPTIKYCSGFYKNTVLCFAVLSVWQTVRNGLLFSGKSGVSVVGGSVGKKYRSVRKSRRPVLYYRQNSLIFERLYSNR